MVTRGQVWEYVAGSHQYRVLIISSDEYNVESGVSPWALFVGPTPARIRAAGLTVPMIPNDPLPRAGVFIPAVFRIDPSALRSNLGFVTEATMTAVELGLRDFLVLP